MGSTTYTVKLASVLTFLEQFGIKLKETLDVFIPQGLAKHDNIMRSFRSDIIGNKSSKFKVNRKAWQNNRSLVCFWCRPGQTDKQTASAKPMTIYRPTLVGKLQVILK